MFRKILVPELWTQFGPKWPKIKVFGLLQYFFFFLHLSLVLSTHFGFSFWSFFYINWKTFWHNFKHDYINISDFDFLSVYFISYVSSPSDLSGENHPKELLRILFKVNDFKPFNYVSVVILPCVWLCGWPIVHSFLLFM